MLSKEERKAKAEAKKKEREEKKAYAKLKKAEKNKTPKIKGSYLKYIFRAVVILIILIFVGLGVYYVLNFENTNSVKRKMDSYQRTLYEQSTEQETIKGFVNGFISIYYTYNPDDDSETRTEELAKYLGVTSTDDSFEYASQVLSSSVTKIIKNGNGYEVHARVAVTQVVKVGEDDNGEVTAVQARSFLVSVPVAVQNGNMSIEATPTYIVETNNASSIEVPEVRGETVEERDKQEIDSLAQSFLKAYCGNSVKELDYFVTEQFNKSVLRNAVAFKGVDKVEAARTDEGYIARVTYKVKTNYSEETQVMVLNIVKKDRFYVNSISSIWW